jgi:hypothetical protein
MYRYNSTACSYESLSSTKTNSTFAFFISIPSIFLGSQKHGSIIITSFVEKMPLSDSRRQSHGYTITASAAEDVSLPTPRVPIHEDITIASGEEEV